MMPGRLIREESGMTMALALMVMVLVGVMGAGLLVFVQNDLRSVIESNQGQKAFNLADAGAQAGKAHLMTDADAIHYDGATDLTASPPNTESPWSYTGAGKTFSLDGIAGNSATVKIQYLLPSTTTAQLNDPNYAPELVPSGQTNYPPGKDYFKVISEGRAGDARRKVEAIYNTFSLDLPQGYYTPGSITLNGNPTITNISLFAKQNVTFNGNPTFTGKDLAYKKWAATGDPTDAGGYTPSYPNSYNSTARQTDAAGIGAGGTISAGSGVAGRDYDSSTNPRFVLSPSNPQSSAEITFPFNPNRQPEMDEMRAAAQAQGNYYEPSSSSPLEASGENGVAATTPKWPANSSTSTVVYVRFTDPTSNRSLTWDVDGVGNCNGVPARGTLVVENGTFTTSQNKLPLRGVVIIRHLGPGNEVYTDTGGNSCMESFVNASGDIKIAGSVKPATQERGNRPGFYGMRLWSWRECYSTTCS